MSVEQRLDFKFSLPEQPGGKVVELSFAEIEELLLNRLREATGDRKDALWQLARFYSHAQQQEPALDYLRQVLALQPDTEHKAATVLAIGQTMEQVGDYESAVRYYREAFALEPMHTATWHFINNNLGFSLNALGRFDEGEPFCRAEPTPDPSKEGNKSAPERFQEPGHRVARARPVRGRRRLFRQGDEGGCE